MRTFTVSVLVGDAIEDVTIKSETFHYVNDTGWLSFQINKKPIAVFAPGKWSYFVEELE